MCKKAIAFLSMLVTPILAAQTLSATAPLTMEEAVATALQRYPAVRVSEAEVRACGRGHSACAHRVPAATQRRCRRQPGHAQQRVRAAASVADHRSRLRARCLAPTVLRSAWGSTVGVLVTWEPFDFGLRQANVAVAEAGRARAEAAVVRTRLDVATLVADSVLTLVAAEQTVTAAQAAVERSRRTAADYRRAG